MDLTEKDTSSGRDMRTYYCAPCNRSIDVEFGVATWQALSDAKKTEPAPAERQADTPGQKSSPFPPPSATDNEIEHDLAVHKMLLDYGRKVFKGEKGVPGSKLSRS